ncbi:MAG: trehalose-phosphatase [Actinomycetota bacterium]
MSGEKQASSLADEVRALGAIAPKAGIFCDFDGSLAPIVPDPGRARPVRGAGRVLERLARRYATVAIISGRPVSFLAKRLHARRVRLVGLYGIEERIGRSLLVLPEVQAARTAIDRAAEQLRAELSSEPGVFVEHKGLAVTVHFRRARDPHGAMEAATPIVARIAQEEGLSEARRGRLALEITPPVRVDKGDVVRRVIEEKGLTGALVVGDDVGDLPTFTALDGLDLAIRVAVASDEAPRELIAAADHVVGSPAEVLELLRNLADASRP